MPLLRARLAAKGRIDDGHFDFMFATPWKVAWAMSNDRVAIDSRRGLRGVVTGERVERRSLLGQTHHFTRSDIADIRGEGGAFRALTRVQLWPKRGRATTLISALDLANWLSDDPWEIYKSWPHRLAQEIKSRLGIAR